MLAILTRITSPKHDPLDCPETLARGMLGTTYTNLVGTENDTAPSTASISQIFGLKFQSSEDEDRNLIRLMPFLTIKMHQRLMALFDRAVSADDAILAIRTLAIYNWRRGIPTALYNEMLKEATTKFHTQYLKANSSMPSCPLAPLTGCSSVTPCSVTTADIISHARTKWKGSFGFETGVYKNQIQYVDNRRIQITRSHSEWVKLVLLDHKHAAYAAKVDIIDASKYMYYIEQGWADCNEFVGAYGYSIASFRVIMFLIHAAHYRITEQGFFMQDFKLDNFAIFPGKFDCKVLSLSKVCVKALDHGGIKELSVMTNTNSENVFKGSDTVVGNKIPTYVHDVMFFGRPYNVVAAKGGHWFRCEGVSKVSMWQWTNGYSGSHEHKFKANLFQSLWQPVYNTQDVDVTVADVLSKL